MKEKNNFSSLDNLRKEEGLSKEKYLTLDDVIKAMDKKQCTIITMAEATRGE